MKKVLEKVDEIYKRYDYVTDKSEVLLFIIKMLILKYLVDNERIALNKSNIRKLRINFTIDGMMDIWSKGDAKGHDWCGGQKLPISAVIWEDVKAFVEGSESFKDQNAGIIGMLYEECLHKTHRKSQGIFYTPNLLAAYMVSQSVSLIKRERILDPACGSGSLLNAAYDYLLKNTKDLEKQTVHKRLLKKALWGIDKDPLAALVTRATLALKGEKYCYPENIQVGDTLNKEGTALKDKSFDVIIGNPPYVGHKEIDSDYMKALKAQYSEVYQNKGDLSYCFFKRGYELLKEKGRLLYLTSRYYMEAYNGVALRRYLKERFKIRRIVDFNGLRVINGIGIDPALTLLEKEKNLNNSSLQVSRFFVQQGRLKETAVYIEDLEKATKRTYEDYTVEQKTLTDDLWRLYSPMTKSIVSKIEEKAPFSLSNLVESFQGIITGNDKAFIFEDTQLGAYNFDSELLHPWIKNKDVKAFSVTPASKQILYTNEIENIEKHPYEEVYLNQFKEKLEGRRECKSGRLPWYGIQWGRNPQCFLQKKIVFPYKASGNRFALEECGYFFSADIYGLALKNRLYSQINEEFLVLLLNSRLYNFYFKAFAKKLGVSLYEYYPNTVMKLKIPDVSPDISGKFKEFYDTIIHLTKTAQEKERDALLFKVDQFFYGYFNIQENEIKMIEKQ